MPSNLNPADGGAVNFMTNTFLSWTGGDPDSEDIVTYDVYFGTSISNMVLVSSGQTSASYDPGTMQNNEWYIWQIISIDNYGATSTGPQWKFKTTN